MLTLNRDAFHLFYAWFLGEVKLYGGDVPAMAQLIFVNGLIVISTWFVQHEKVPSGIKAAPMLLSLSLFYPVYCMEANWARGLLLLVVFTYSTRIYEILFLGLYDHEKSLKERVLHCFSPVVEVCLKERVESKEERKKMLRNIFIEFGVVVTLHNLTYMAIWWRHDLLGFGKMNTFLSSYLGALIIMFLLTMEGLFVEFLYLVFDQTRVPKVMIYPLLSLSVKEFWGRRWNRPVHYLLKRYVYVPIRYHMKMGNSAATIAAFFASGVYHVVPLTVGGLGVEDAITMMTYFLTQAIFMFLERIIGTKHWPWPLQWAWTSFATTAPLYLFIRPYFHIVNTDI